MSKKKNTKNNKLSWIISGAVAIIAIIVAIILYLPKWKENKVGNLEIVESGWTYEEVAGTYYTWYGVAVSNTREGQVAEFPRITVTARRADNSILFSSDYACSFDYIFYGETLYCGGYLTEQAEEPATIDFKAVAVDEWVDEKTVSYTKNSDLAINNIEQINDEYSEKYKELHYTAEISNNSDTDIYSARVVTTFRKDGKIVGTHMTYVKRLPSNDSSAFENHIFNTPDYDTYEITVHVVNIN